MIVWFGCLAVMGLVHISDDPTVLAAINPWYAIHFLLTHGTIGMVTLGAVFLAVTGGEALYADLGHFGRKPIQAGWLYFVLPSLLVNYFGQGALVLSDPAAIENSFYRMVPEILLLPLVVLATAATVIASQAVITGAYSLTRQAVQLGLLPRFEVRYTSETHAGQIYLPRVNRLLLIGVLLLVLLFRTSSGLASAYGIAVSTTMVADGIMGFVVIWKLWNWRAATAAALIVPFVVVDMTFFSANLLKLLEGAWVPLLFGFAMAIMIWTWRRGAAFLTLKTRRIEVPLTDLIKSLEKRPPHIVKGTAVFLTSDPSFVPTALLHNLKHNKVLHEHNVILTIQTAQTPRVDPAERVWMETISDKFAIRPTSVRLHGISQRSEGAGDRPQARLAVRYHVDIVFRLAALAEAICPVRNAEVAGPPVHCAEPVGERRHRLFPNSDRAGGRSRNPSDNLTVHAFLHGVTPKSG